MAKVVVVIIVAVVAIVLLIMVMVWSRMTVTDDNVDSDDEFYDDVIAQSASNWMEKD